MISYSALEAKCSLTNHNQGTPVPVAGWITRNLTCEGAAIDLRGVVVKSAARAASAPALAPVAWTSTIWFAAAACVILSAWTGVIFVRHRRRNQPWARVESGETARSLERLASDADCESAAVAA